jgi:hypothetical protein
VGGVAITYGNILMTAYVVGSAMEARRKAKSAAAAARRAYLDSMQDRSVMVRSATAPRQYVYGVDRVSGPVVDMFTTGDTSQYLHIIVALAAREVDAVEAVYLNEIELPAPDSNGFITSGQ